MASKFLDAERYEHECRIRDRFAANLANHRPTERVVGREYRYRGAHARADLRTVDETQLLREWEFKLRADYSALGQVLVYTAMARRETNFSRRIQGVIAAFEFPDDLRVAVEILNLNVELVTLPRWMAGGVPRPTKTPLAIPNIPNARHADNDQG